MNPYASPILNGLESPNQEAYFAYVFDQVLTANQSVSGQVVINADADFVLRGIVVNTLTGIFRVRFNRSGLYFLSSGFIHSNNLLSDAASPLPIIPEMLFVAGSRIGIDIVDLSGATNTVQISFVGAKRTR